MRTIDQQLTKELEQIGRQWDKAIVDNNALEIGRFMAADWVIIGTEGGITSKPNFLDYVKSGDLHHNTMDFEDIRVKIYENTAIVISKGTSSGTYKGEPFSYYEWSTNVYIIPTGRLLDYQGTSIQKGDSLVATDIVMKDVRIDHDFFATYQIPFVSGRNFSKEIKTDDSLGFVINETAAKMIGLTNEEAVGQVLQNGPTKGRIIGVVKDFHFESLHEPIVPAVFIGQNDFSTISILISESEMKPALAHLEKVWNQFVPHQSFSYGFLSDRYSDLYKNEKSQNELFIIFAALAIFIACMGLFGLATFNTLQRSKEVSIRKVLGAPVGSILQLLSKEILILILIANVISWPIAWYFMSEWLNGFAYHIDMNVLTYIGAGMLTLVITLITISTQTLKAALTNPATILRNE